MLNAIVFGLAGSVGLLLDALMACRNVHVAPQTEPPVSAAEVTVKVIATLGPNFPTVGVTCT
jgi:hypothetical protein